MFTEHYTSVETLILELQRSNAQFYFKIMWNH